MVAPRLSEAERSAQAVSHQARLQKFVLGWDYLRLLAQSKESHGKKRSRENKELDNVLRKVPERFSDLAEYLAVFESLLLAECRAQILRGDEEGGTQCHMVGVKQWEKANEFHFVRLAIESSREFTENDLVLLCKEKPGEGGLLSTYSFASVEGQEGQNTLRVRLYLDREGEGVDAVPSEATFRVRTALQGASSAWWLLKLCNLSTIMREYTALRSVGLLPFVDVILSADVTEADPGQSGSWNIPKPLLEYLQTSHNESQLQAIQAGLSREPLVLIQGPPGTGKTQTILGLLSVLLHSTSARQPFKDGELVVAQKLQLSYKEKMDNWMKASPWLGKGVNPRDLNMPLDGDDGFFPSSGSQFKTKALGYKRKHRAHVLVCAPSNSALDEIVLRLLHTGVRDENGLMYTPSIVRVGLNVHHSVNSVSMDTLVSQRLSSMERSAIAAGPRGGSAGMERDRMRIAILDEAAIVCSTLSYSGAGVFMRMNRGFDVVVIDEAAQAVEPSTLVPLVHGCRQVFLVGDPIQLPATVLSTEAVLHGYDTSMFKRFQKAGYPVQMLKTQYRMHPQIREFPSNEFYEAALEDGREVEKVTKRPWHEHRCFGPFAFFDITGTESQPIGSGSWMNKDEVEFVLVLYRHMVATYPELKGGPHVAVISPYKLQVKLLRERFTEVLGQESARLIDINTVDGFQGREKDVAIFSCVRSRKGKSIGFVSDYRRMNVGLTRARASMLVVGCADSLRIDKHWKNLITSARKRCRYFKVTKPYHGLFNDESLAAMKNLAAEEEAKRMSLELSAAAVDSTTDGDLTMEEAVDEEAEETFENCGEVDEDDDM